MVIFSMDFEEQLDIFILRKNDEFVADSTNYRNDKGTYQQFKNIYTCIPIMLKDVKTLKNESWIGGSSNIIEIFSGRVYFRNCIVYGKILGRGNDSKTRYTYFLDDGTSCLNISIPRRTEDMDTMWKLENELQAIKKEMLSTQSKSQVIQSLQGLLFRTKQQIDHSNLINGTKVLLYGRPNSFCEQISLNVFSLIEDNTIERDVEIAFKDFLIDWSRKNNT